MEDHMLDQMIWDLSSSEAQKILIGKDEKLKLNDAVSIVRNFEATRQHIQSLNSMNNSSSVNALSRHTRGRNPHKFLFYKYMCTNMLQWHAWKQNNILLLDFST